MLSLFTGSQLSVIDRAVPLLVFLGLTGKSAFGELSAGGGGVPSETAQMPGLLFQVLHSLSVSGSKSQGKGSSCKSPGGVGPRLRYHFCHVLGVKAGCYVSPNLRRD